MNAAQIIRLPDPRLQVHAEMREVVQDFRGAPHLFMRVRLTGWHFPHRAPEPFMLVGKAVSHHVVISRDGLTADGYFDRLLPRAKELSFGYGKVISWDFPLHWRPIPVLDRAKLPPGLIDHLRKQ